MDTQDVGTDHRWLKALVAGEVEKPKSWSESDLKEVVAAKPKSRIQEIIQSFYTTLYETIQKGAKFTGSGEIVEQPSEDLFDVWFKALPEKERSGKLTDFLNTVAGALHLSEETETEKLLKKIAARCLEEHDYVAKVREVVNEKYPGLAAEYRHIPSVAELNEMEAEKYNREMSQIDSNITSNIDKYATQIARIKKATKTNFERTAQGLDKVVIFGESMWELMLYALMSPYAPRLIENKEMDIRANLHLLMPGDISTAKSKILKIVRKIAPKSYTVDETTKASFEGVAPTKSGEEIEDGIIDRANDGSMLVEELTPQFVRGLGGLFRRVMDCEEIKLEKKGSRKVLDVNTTMIAACNPIDDFFTEDGNFREQIDFKEGILSRFDITIPLMATQVKNELLLPKIHLMTDASEDISINLSEVAEDLITIATGMATVTRVIATPEQEQRLMDAFNGRNRMDSERRLLKGRPLVILRDYETLCRLANVIATVNFSKRKIADGVLTPGDEDIDKAIQLWESLIQMRVNLYTKHDRNMRSIGDEIVLYIHGATKNSEEDEVDIAEVENHIVNEQRFCGRSTFYKEITALEENGRLLARGQRNKRLAIVVK